MSEAKPAESLIPSPAPAASTRPLREAKPPDKQGWWWGTGRRKTAVARVRLRPVKGGEAKFVVQQDGTHFKTIEQYFSELRDRNDCHAPLKATNTEGKFEIIIRAAGGGPTGQAGAIKMGIARALRDYDPTLEGVLRDGGYLTRDSRAVERKKYGQAGARRRYQFSKR